MEINVSQQLKESTGSVRYYEVKETINIADNGSLVQGKVKLICTDRSILVMGSLHTEVSINCSRCLSTFHFPLDVTVEDEFFPTTDILTATPQPVPVEAECFTINKYNILDLTEAVRQHVLLDIPMRPLCHQDCAGLCPSCGHNLNQGTCACPSG